MLKDAVFCYVVARYGTAQYAILFVACHCFSNSYMRLYHALLPCVVLYPVVSSCNMLFWYPSLLSFSALSCMLVLHVLFSCILSYYVVLHYSTSSGVRLYHAASLYIYIHLSLSLSLPCLQCPCRPCTDAILGSFPNACSALSSANA